MLEHEEDNMENVGCDIGKNNLDVFFKGKHRRYENSLNGIGKFIITCCKDREIVVLEPSGGYERKLLQQLFEGVGRKSVLREEFCEKREGSSKNGQNRQQDVG